MMTHSPRPPLHAPKPWSNSFATLGEDFYVALAPTPVPEPYWVARNTTLSAELGWSWSDENEDVLLQELAGNRTPAGAVSLASVYSGHQFGVWAGQLGDGRAILLGDIAGHEIQLKGSGLTPFSRMGDGRAVLRSSIREFLASEAVHALGIPTSRALSIVGSDLPVRRETMETAAVVTRVAPSFIRFGHFEHFCHHDLHPQLRQLADFVIDRYYPACRTDPRFEGNPYASFLNAVSERTAAMVAQWQAVGFCHGVMNTDNMSILGQTLDYGPFQFLDAFDPGHICNHSDHQGRYAFNKQPQVAYWNLVCLGQALLPLIGDQEQAVAALDSFKACYLRSFSQQMAAKLGWERSSESTAALADSVWALLANERVDYPIFWRRLSQWSKRCDFLDSQVRDLFLQPKGIEAWLQQFSAAIALAPASHSADLMLRTNPKYVLRNHLGELAIRAANNRDYAPVSRLLAVLQTPFDEHPGCEDLADFPPAWAGSIAISCSS
ncbi:MAG: YdiU family protein [Rhodoferax sp.]|nr:YdiU family protein [Rhodoferax sp.]